MKILKKIADKYNFYFLAIIPVLYFLIGAYFRYLFGDLSLRSVDPDYMHFLSGVAISVGKFNQANIDHPGTTLQIILAIIFRIVYLFRGNTQPYFEDVIINSDMYLSVANLTLTTIISISILIAGNVIFKISGKLVYALLIQSSPFLPNILYDIIGRIYPELLLPIPIFIIVALLFKSLYQQEEIPSPGWFAFAVAFGLATKATFFPVAVLPFFVLKKGKSMLRYVLFSILFYLILALPVTLHLDRYWHWMKGLLVHSGTYGTGQPNVIKPDEFIQNLREIFHSEQFIYYTTGMLILTSLVILVFKINRKNQTIPHRIAAGITLLLFIQTFLICKQYAYRYFVPVLLFSPFILILIGEQIIQTFKNRNIYVVVSVLLIFALVRFLYIQIPSIQLRTQYIGEQMQARIQSRHTVATLPEDSYKIIVTQDYGCPFHEYAIMHSFCVAGPVVPDYRERLAKIYPRTYQFFTWDNTIKYWGADFDPANGEKLIIYAENDSPDLLKKTLVKFFDGKPYHTGPIDTLFLNPRNHEIIYQVPIIRSDSLLTERP